MEILIYLCLRESLKRDVGTERKVDSLGADQNGQPTAACFGSLIETTSQGKAVLCRPHLEAMF